MKTIPKPVVVITGDQYKVQQTIDDFFVETRELIEARLSKLVSPPFFEIKSCSIVNEQGVINDDRLTYLLYQDRMVCGVFERRTNFNNIEYTFFRDIRSLDNLH